MADIKTSVRRSDELLALLQTTNNLIDKANSLYFNYFQYKQIVLLNNYLEEKLFPFLSSERSTYTLRLSELEKRKEAIHREINSLGMFNVIRKQKLYNQLQEIEDDINLNYNWFCRTREQQTQTVLTINDNRIKMEKLDPFALASAYSELVETRLNPAIKQLSQETKTVLPLSDPKIMQKQEQIKLEFINTQSSEME